MTEKGEEMEGGREGGEREAGREKEREGERERVELWNTDS